MAIRQMTEKLGVNGKSRKSLKSTKSFSQMTPEEKKVRINSLWAKLRSYVYTGMFMNAVQGEMQ